MATSGGGADDPATGDRADLADRDAGHGDAGGARPGRLVRGQGMGRTAVRADADDRRDVVRRAVLGLRVEPSVRRAHPGDVRLGRHAPGRGAAARPLPLPGRDEPRSVGRRGGDPGRPGLPDARASDRTSRDGDHLGVGVGIDVRAARVAAPGRHPCADSAQVADLLDEVHPTLAELVVGAGDRAPSCPDRVGDGHRPLRDQMHGVPYVLLHRLGLVDLVEPTIAAAGGDQARGDPLDDLAQVAGRHRRGAVCRDRRRDRPAPVVAEHHDQRDAECRHGELQ